MKNIGCYPLFVLLYIAACFSGCTRPGEAMPFGSYLSPCIKLEQGGSAKGLHNFQSNKSYSFESSFFADDDCTHIVRMQQGLGTYTFSTTNLNNASGAYPLDISMKQFASYAYTEHEVANFSSYGWLCNESIVTIGVPVICTINKTVYTAIRFGDREGYFGVFSHELDGSTPDRRPNDFESVGIEPTTDTI